MNKRSEKYVLAIYPNQLGFGYSVMTNALTLKEYQIVVSRPMSNKTLMKRITQYIDYYEPDVVVLEDYKGLQSRKSKRVQKLIDEISTYSRNNKITLAQYSRGQIKSVFQNFKARTKHEIASVLADNIPELKKKLQPKRLFYKSESYYAGIFDSTSLAVTHYYITE